MLLSAIDQYSNFQTSGQRIEQSQATQETEVKEKQTKLTDMVSISDKQVKLQSIADHFDVGNITFNQVNFLKSALFSEGLIPIKATDALTMATQSQPNHKHFSLAEITSQFYSTPGNLSFKPLLAPMQALFANLEAMHQSELSA